MGKKRLFSNANLKVKASKTINRENVALLSESSISQVIQVVMEVPFSVHTLTTAGSAVALSHLAQDECE